jgi:hypothetical protein
MDGQPSGVVPKPMRGGTAFARGTETREVETSKGKGQERIGRGPPGNTGPRERIRRMLTSSEPRPHRDAIILRGGGERSEKRQGGEAFVVTGARLRAGSW